MYKLTNDIDHLWITTKWTDSCTPIVNQTIIHYLLQLCESLFVGKMIKSINLLLVYKYVWLGSVKLTQINSNIDKHLTIWNNALLISTIQCSDSMLYRVTMNICIVDNLKTAS